MYLHASFYIFIMCLFLCACEQNPSLDERTSLLCVLNIGQIYRSDLDMSWPTSDGRPDERHAVPYPSRKSGRLTRGSCCYRPAPFSNGCTAFLETHVVPKAGIQRYP